MVDEFAEDHLATFIFLFISGCLAVSIGFHYAGSLLGRVIAARSKENNDD